MSWQGIEGHDEVVDKFRLAIERGRLASTFLFVGPAGIGKRAFARQLAKSLLCARAAETPLEPCGHCESCHLIDGGTHPDLDVIAKPKDKSTIPLELLIGRDDKRLHEGLCHRLSLKPYLSDRKIAIIDDADALNVEGANCLLKTLEEPPPRSLLVLVGTSADKQLPTIRSRSQIVRFAPLPVEVVARLLEQLRMVADSGEAHRLAEFSSGSLERAIELSDPELWTFRRQLFDRLAALPPDGVELARTINQFVEAAGKDAPPRRQRARQVVAFTSEFYRQLTRALAGSSPSPDPEVQQAVARVAPDWLGDQDAALRCVERCLDTLEHIDRNLHLPTVIDAWVDRLTQISAPASAC